MSQYRHSIFVLVAISWLSACDIVWKSEEPKISVLNPSVCKFRENEYLEIKHGVFGIEKAAPGPLWFNEEVLLVGSQNIEEKLHKESYYLLIPKTHSFAQHFIENPFQGEKSFMMVRPSIWGLALILQKIENNTALFKIDKELTKTDLPTISASDSLLSSNKAILLTA